MIVTNKHELENCANAYKYNAFDAFILGNNIFVCD